MVGASQRRQVELLPLLVVQARLFGCSCRITRCADFSKSHASPQKASQPALLDGFHHRRTFTALLSSESTSRHVVLTPQCVVLATASAGVLPAMSARVATPAVRIRPMARSTTAPSSRSSRLMGLSPIISSSFFSAPLPMSFIPPNDGRALATEGHPNGSLRH